MSERDAFFGNVRRALGRTGGAGDGQVTGVSPDALGARQRARAAMDDAEARAGELLSELEVSATEAGWRVARTGSAEDAARYVAALARDLKARSIVRSAHAVFDLMDLEAALSPSGVGLTVMALDEVGDEADPPRLTLREKAITADMGITGVDYAIAETGSCVLLAGKGVSRLVALAPPVHVAIVRRGQVLPSLDELFVLQNDAAVRGNVTSYMNIITGPSRSADIEQTIVTGVHGPGEVHMVLLG